MRLRSFDLVIKAKVPDNLHEEDVLSIIKEMITNNTGCAVTSIAGIRAPYDSPDVILDREIVRAALLSRMSKDGVSIQDSVELRERALRSSVTSWRMLCLAGSMTSTRCSRRRLRESDSDIWKM
jgi:hypothetical protein